MTNKTFLWYNQTFCEMSKKAFKLGQIVNRYGLLDESDFTGYVCQLIGNSKYMGRSLGWDFKIESASTQKS